MTTSEAMPDVQVEVAFNAGYSTLDGDRVWTDVSDHAELKAGVAITHGRQDETATADANKLTLTLDNSDGRYTAGKVDGAHYPNVKIGRPIRVTTTPQGGSPSIRFLGYVDEWPVVWDGTDAYASAQISASSRIARLGFDSDLRSAIDLTFLGAGPAAYFPLDEPAGALVAADLTGNSQALTMSGTGADVTFGGSEGSSAGGATFTSGGKILSGPLGVPISNDVAINGGALVEVTMDGTAPGRIFRMTGPGQDGTKRSFRLELQDTGDLDAYFNYGTGAGTGITATSNVGLTAGPLHVAVRCYRNAPTMGNPAGSSVIELYIDGVLVDSDSTIGSNLVSFDSLYLGEKSFGFGLIGSSLAGTLSKVAIGGDFTTMPTRYDVQPYELAGDRIEQLAAYANIPATEVAADPGDPVAPIETTGKTVISVMRTVEATEGGVLFDDRDNTLTFHDRTRRYDTTAVITLDAEEHEVEAGISPKLDRSELVNDVTATAADGSKARSFDQDSIDEYGVATKSMELASTNDAAVQAAAWQIHLYKDPKQRIPSLGIDLLPLSLARQEALLSVGISSRIDMINLPAQAPSSEMSAFAEGYVETIGRESYSFVFNVSPTEGYDEVFTLDDPVLGVLDGPYPLAY